MSQANPGSRPRPRPDWADDSQEEALDFERVRHYLYAPLRRPWLVVAPAVGCILLSAAALTVLPKRYRSSTLILIESEKVPESFVPKVATEDRSQRLDAIRPEILSRTRLETVVGETRPYPEISSTRAAVDLLRRKISINPSGSDGFTIEFVHPDPRKAQEVTNRLATLFIEETMKSRRVQVEDAVDFLVTQVNEARAALEKKEEEIRSLKEQRMGRLPEQLEANLATMAMLQQELRTVEESLLFARERQELVSRGDRSAASETLLAPGSQELIELQRQLTAMNGRYTAEHPDVQSLKGRIALLEARLRQSASGSSPRSEAPAAAERSATATAEVDRLETKRRDLESRIDVLRARVDATPRTEQELTSLSRDYEKLKENYAALLAKQLDAQMAGRLERRWKGDRFRMLDPADLPEKPYFPRPPLILGLGAFGGLLLGLAASLGAEFLDPTIKDVAELRNLHAYNILACIPHFPDLQGTPER